MVALCHKTKGHLFLVQILLGVNIFFEINEYLAKMMTKLDSYNIHMEEIHHTQN
jgi:4-hydroxy-tetrahydrodipicolinate reductase